MFKVSFLSMTAAGSGSIVILIIVLNMKVYLFIMFSVNSLSVSLAKTNSTGLISQNGRVQVEKQKVPFFNEVNIKWGGCRRYGYHWQHHGFDPHRSWPC